MLILLIILINLLFYYKTLSYGIICDDIPVFNQSVTIPKGRWMKFWYHWHGRKYTNIKLAHAIVLGIHTINCILIYIAFGMNYVSLAAALLFSVNPVNNQCSIWISGKGYATNLTCALLMWIFPLASPIIYLFGTYFCGASLIFFPLVFLFTNYWYLSLLVLLGLYREYSRVFNKADPKSKFNTESNKELLTIHPKKFILAFKTYGYYIVNTITALRLGYYHKYNFLHGVCQEENKKSYKIDRYFFIGIVMLVLTLWTRNIGLIWFTINIAMWCNVMTFNQTLANRYIYIGNAGLMLSISYLLMLYPPLALALLIYYSTLLYKFMIFYLNEYWSIEYSCMEQPDFFYPWQNRAVHCFMNNNYQGALGNMIKANELHPNDWKIAYNLSQIYMMLGNIKACREWYNKALSCNIEGREKEIKSLMDRLNNWIIDVEDKAKVSNQVDLDINKFDMQR